MLKEKSISPKITQIEKFADAMTHGIGVGLSIMAFVLLIFKAAFLKDTWVFLSFSLYGITLISAYLSSTIYHLYMYYHKNPNKNFKRFLLLYDHCSIFFLIAGSYSPVLLIFLRDSLGFIFFVVIWVLALMGVLYKIYFLGKFRKFSIFMYLSMGWCIVLSAKELLVSVPHNLLLVLIIGGLFYTSGIVFYQKKSVPFNHAIWHIFVLIGSIIHFFGFLMLV